MDFFKVDSPFMNMVRTVVDMILLDLLCIFCCIPIITIGASLTAKYYVSMKMTRDDESGIVVPFFTAFANNFKQSTLVWMTQLVVLVLIFIDWYYIYQLGFNAVDTSYKLSICVITAVFFFVNMVAYPMIARFKLTFKELYKGVFVFIFSHFFPLLAILILIVALVFASIWYFSWLPLILVFASVSVTFFLSSLCDKEFKKLEDSNKDEDEEVDKDIEEEELSSEELALYAEIEAQEALANSYAGSRKALKQIEDVSEKSYEKAKENQLSPEELDAQYKESRKIKNRIRKFFKDEKSKLSKLTTKQKFQYVAEYYLPGVIAILIFGGCIAWYTTDVYKASQIVISGGLINCPVTEENIDSVTKNFITWADYGKKKAVIVDTDLSFDSTQVYDNQSMENAFIAQIAAGYYDFLLIGEPALEHYSELDFFVTVTDIIPDLSSFDSDALYFHNNVPVAIKLSNGAKEKLGLRDDNNYYIAYVAIGKQDAKNVMFTEYLFGVNFD